MKEFWSKKASELTPYTAGEQPAHRMIKLNTNENAYPPSAKVVQAIAQAAKTLRLYPRPDADVFQQAAAAENGVRKEQIFCANGSDEALALSFLAFFSPGRPVKTMDVTYSFYPVWAQMFDLTLQTVPLLDDFSVNVEGMCGGKNAVVANPNAPTGMALALGELQKMIESTDGVVIIDEAYVDFGAESAVSLVGRCQNLAVVRTLSKSHSLAGLRAGYVVADENLIAALRTVRDSFNSYPVDALAQAGAAAALADRAYHQKIKNEVIQTRETTVKALQGMGIAVLPSKANFIFMKCATKPAEQVFSALRERDILVRYFEGERTKDYLRVTIGTPEEMQQFLEELKEIV